MMNECEEVATAMLQRLPPDLARNPDMDDLRTHVRDSMVEGETEQVIDNVASALRREIEMRREQHRAQHGATGELAP